MQRLIPLWIILIALCFSNDLEADQKEENSVKYTVQPIGHIEKENGETCIILKEQYEAGLLGLSEFSHVYVSGGSTRSTLPSRDRSSRFTLELTRQSPFGEFLPPVLLCVPT